MAVDLDKLVLDALSLPRDAIYVGLRQSLERAFVGTHISEVEDGTFDIERFTHGEKRSPSPREGFNSQWVTSWWDEHHRTYERPFAAWRVVEWEGERFEVLTVGIMGKFQREERSFVFATDEDKAEEFITVVCQWCSEVRGEILIFREGCWQHDSDLYEAIKSTTLDTLILAPGVKEGIVNECARFLDSREVFERYKLPWKRGFLFLGPPGNGKTHMIKGLVNHLQCPCLYVRNFTAEYATDEDNISKVFRRARSTAPCLLVFEDLDAMLTDENRSFFLNELDGFYGNDGLLTIATTNHPERLDPAILNRPSRFDRKFTFGLPSIAERERFLQSFGERLEPGLRLTEGETASAAKATSEFSFAYLKELYISSVMEWIGNDGKWPIGQLMLSQVDILAAEMKSGVKAEAGPAPRPRRRMPPGYRMPKMP